MNLGNYNSRISKSFVALIIILLFMTSAVVIYSEYNIITDIITDNEALYEKRLVNSMDIDKKFLNQDYIPKKELYLKPLISDTNNLKDLENENPSNYKEIAELKLEINQQGVSNLVNKKDYSQIEK